MFNLKSLFLLSFRCLLFWLTMQSYDGFRLIPTFFANFFKSIGDRGNDKRQFEQMGLKLVAKGQKNWWNCSLNRNFTLPLSPNSNEHKLQPRWSGTQNGRKYGMRRRTAGVSCWAWYSAWSSLFGVSRATTTGHGGGWSSTCLACLARMWHRRSTIRWNTTRNGRSGCADGIMRPSTGTSPVRIRHWRWWLYARRAIGDGRCSCLCGLVPSWVRSLVSFVWKNIRTWRHSVS